MLVNGEWKGRWDPYQKADKDGRFVRQTSSFRHWVTPDGSAGPTGEAGFKAEAGRYHLYVALICPWASRTLMARSLLGLEDVISVSVTEPVLGDNGWVFGNDMGSGDDPLHGFDYMHQLYSHADSTFTGRATVPVLWDKATDRLVNNESADILRMMTTGFRDFHSRRADLYPAAFGAEIDALAERMYHSLNNGVYKSGFAQTQAAYEEAVRGVFDVLDEMEDRLSDGRRYLMGDTLTEADIRLFVTLVRFDAAYYGLFKTNIRRIADYPALSRYTDRVWSIPEVERTVDIDHIKTGYYSIRAINPTGIVPVGPGELRQTARKAA